MKSPMASAVKQLTSDAHRRAEEAVRAFDPFASRAQYARYLARLHPFYAALEPQVQRWLPEPARVKLPLLERDLTALGVAPGARMDAPRIRSEAAAFGVAYVLEGKTLGARFLLDEVKTALGDDIPCELFAGYGAQTGPMWMRFREELEAFTGRNGRRVAIVEAAQATFTHFISTLNRRQNRPGVQAEPASAARSGGSPRPAPPHA